jgi:hypothetical protein
VKGLSKPQALKTPAGGKADSGQELGIDQIGYGELKPTVSRVKPGSHTSSARV